MLASVALIAILLFVGSMIRTHTDSDPTRGVGGLRILAEGDHLLAFEDFGFGAGGWLPAVTTDRLPGLGPVLGPHGSGEVSRRFALPSGTTEVHLSMDLHLLGAWTGPLRLWIDGQEVVALARPAPDAPGLFRTEGPGHAALVQGEETVPPRPEAALPGPARAFTSYAVRITAVPVGATMDVRLQAAPPVPDASAGAGSGPAIWALDNLTVIALSGPATAAPPE